MFAERLIFFRLPNAHNMSDQCLLSLSLNASTEFLCVLLRELPSAEHECALAVVWEYWRVIGADPHEGLDVMLMNPR